METLSYSAVVGHYAKACTDCDEELAKRASAFPEKWVVLDDDPTGVQTVHDVYVYTDWKKETFLQALREPDSLFYVLTNSRGLTAEESSALHCDLMDNLIAASRETGVQFQILSRSDSTLRGHFPLETDLLNDKLVQHGEKPADGVILAPFFEAGGRFTVNNIHYVRQGDTLVPAAQTEFAKDATFGYTQSDLTAYIEEKTGRKQEVLAISLETLRRGDADAVEETLVSAKNGQYIIVNALHPADLRVFAAGLYRALSQGKRFLYRTAADFVKAVGNIKDKPRLTREEMVQTSGAGILIVGSHTQKTTAQMERLKDVPGLELIAFDSDKVLDGTLPDETKRVCALADSAIRRGKTPVVFTRRTLLRLPDDTKEAALRRSVDISDALTRVVTDLSETPAFVIAKGGITSSDIGVKALHVRRATVLGQIQPGVPVWRCGEESRFPGIPYVIFPGNVGSDDTLLAAVTRLVGIR